MTRLRRTWAICLKEFRHIRRDPRILFLVVLSPAIMLVAFAYLFSLEVQQIRLAILDYDQSRLSRDYVSFLTSDGEVRVVAMPQSYSQIYDLFLHGQVDVALVIPPHLEADLSGYSLVPIQAVVDGSDPIAAMQAIGNLTARTTAFNAGLFLTGRAITGLPVETRSRIWFNPEVKSLISMVPGLIAIVLIVPGLGIAIAVTREKEVGTFEGLVSTPVRGAEFLLGKLVAYATCSMVSSLIVLAIAVLWFKVPFRGDLFLYLSLTLEYILAVMGFGVLVATLASSQQAAMLIVLLIFFVPSFFLTGLILPVNPQSPLAQFLSAILPATHYILICRGLFLKALGLAELRDPTFILAAMTLITVGLSIALFRKEAI